MKKRFLKWILASILLLSSSTSWAYWSSFERLEWGSRNTDTFYCLDIFDQDWQILKQAVACGQGLHEYSPRDLTLSTGKYHWKVWSPSISATYHEQQLGFEGEFDVPNSYSDKKRIIWPKRNDDSFYCLDIFKTAPIELYQQAVVCGENLHSYSTERLNLPPDGYLSKVWSPSVKDYLKLGIGEFSKEFEVYESVSQPISTYHELKWSYRGDDEFYCLDIFDKDWRLLHQAVACGEGLHQFSPRNLNLAPGEYHWKVWSPSVANYHEAQPGLEGDFTAGECGLPYRSDEYWVQWGCRNQDLLYCIDIYDEDGQPIAKPYHCAEYLHQFSPRALDNLGISEPEKYRWKVWSPSVTNYDDPQPEFEGEFYFEPPKPITPAMNVSWEVLRAHEISSLHIDDEGILWLGTTGGLEKWQLAPTQQLLASWHRTSNGFPANQINAIAPGANNSLWLATDQGLVNFREGTVFKHFTSDNSLLPTQNVRTVEADGKGGIWVGLTQPPHLIHFDGFNHWRTIEIPKAISDKYPFTNLMALTSDPQRGLWIGLKAIESCYRGSCLSKQEGGIVHYDGQGTWYILNHVHENTPKYSGRLVTDEQGKLWTTNLGPQLVYFDGQNWQEISFAALMDQNQVSEQPFFVQLLAGNKQGLWISWATRVNYYKPNLTLQARQISKYNEENQWDTFELENPFNNSLFDIVGLGDRLWFHSSNYNLTYFDGGTWQFFIPSLLSSSLNAFFQSTVDLSTGRLWMIRRNLSFHTDKNFLVRQTGKGNWQTLPYVIKQASPSETRLEQILSANDGRGLWVVVNGQLIYIDGHGNSQIIPTPNNQSANVFKFANDKKGGLWMAGERKLSYFHFNEPIQEYSLNRLPQEDVNYLFHDGQKLWIGMWTTLASFDGQHWQMFNIKSILEDKGYEFDIHGYSAEVGEVAGIQTIVSDNAGGVWLGIDNLYGILHFDGQETWWYFNDNQKLPMGDQSKVIQLYNDNDGQLWATTNIGVIRLRFE